MAVKQEKRECFVIQDKEFDQIFHGNMGLTNTVYLQISLPSSLSRKILKEYGVKKYAFLERDDSDNLEPAFLDFDSVVVCYHLTTNDNFWNVFYDKREKNKIYGEHAEFYCQYLTLNDDGDITDDNEDGMTVLKIHPDDEDRIFREIYKFIVEFKDQHGYSELYFGTEDHLSGSHDVLKEES